MAKSMVRHSMGKKGDSFLTEAARFIKREVNAVENKLESEARSIAVQSTILGVSVGIVAGIVGTLLMQKYVTGPVATVQVQPPAPPGTVV